MKFEIKNILPHVVAIVIFLLVNVVYFLPQLQGKQLRQSDSLQFKGMAAEAFDYREEGENILWTNSMFSGMPTYQISAQENTNISKYLERVLKLFFKGPIGIFISGMIAFYLCMLLLGVNNILAAIGAIIFSFNPNNLVLFEAGHNTKIRALLLSIMVVVGVIKLVKKQYLLGGVVFGLGMALSLYANHYQMTYYVGLILGIYALVSAAELIIKKDYKSLGKIALVGLLAAFIGIGASTSKLWSTYEYAHETIRGKPVLEADASPNKMNKGSASKGLDWEYANQWSNGIIDLVAIYIPGAAGGGSSEPVAKNGATNKFMKKNRMRTLDYGPMYWGKLPFTSGPSYLGAIPIFLFILSLFFIKGSLKWWGLAAFVFTLFISMGKNMEWFNRILFDYVPMFNKFRAPSSVLGVTAIVVSLLAVLGIDQFFKTKYDEKAKAKVIKNIVIVASSLSAISLFYAFIGPNIFDFEASGDGRYAKQVGLSDAFQSERAAILRRDALRSLLFVIAAAGVLFLYLKDKLKKLPAMLLLAVLMFLDLIPVNTRYVSHSDFVKKREVKSLLAPREVDSQILKDSDRHYRVHDVSVPEGPFKSTTASLHHKTIGGYHAAKLQRYQDLIEQYLSKGTPQVLNMLNAKYFIMGQPGKEEVRQNGQALGNAWFVDSYSFVEKHRDELDALENLDPRNAAVLKSEFKEEIDRKLSGSSSSNGTIKLTSYHPERLVYKSNNAGAGLAVFSEVWYGPSLGWHCYVDGNEVNLVRANYILRAAVIPEGEHEIVMEFKPTSVRMGNIVGSIFSLVLIVGLGFSIWLGIKRRKEIEK